MDQLTNKAPQWLKNIFTLLWLTLGILLVHSSTTFAKGDGIKVGNSGRFHPRLFVNFGYDNNVLSRSYNTSQAHPFAPIEGAPFLTVRPGLELLVGTKSTGFYLGGYANYTHFISNVVNSTINTVTGKADLGVQFLKNKPVTIKLSNNFSRSSGDNYTAADIFARAIHYFHPGTQNASAFVTIDNRTNLTLGFKPGGGALTIDVGYTFGFHFYPSPDLDSNEHLISLNMKWNFFPRTAFTFDGTFHIVNYNPRFNFSQSSPTNNNMMPFKAHLGLIGQLTERLLLTFRVGGGYTLVTSNSVPSLASDNYGMVIGNIDLTYKIRLTTFIRVGFRHDFSPSVFSNYYNETIGYAEFGTQFGPATRPFVLNIKGDGGYIGYGKIPRTLGTGSFTSTIQNSDGTLTRGDLLVRGTLLFDWYPYKFWKIGILGRTEFTSSNMSVLDSGNQIGLGYFKLEVMLNTELAF